MVWKTGRVWIVAAREALDWRGWGRRLHRTAGEFTGGRDGVVGAVGNAGRSEIRLGGFSNCPELHRRVLEIGGRGEMTDREGDGHGFHFSALNDGDYGNSSLFSSEKHPYSRSCEWTGVSWCWKCQDESAGSGPAGTIEKGTGIPEKEPGFPRANRLRRCIESKQVNSSRFKGSVCGVALGQAGAVAWT